ncbi:MAG: polyprenyl synthetase family protein [Deltaproteobacteria bacterium]|jgi:geranylgeranyl diphosphate synthase type II|nr:polyprenyl synthetase family protein [Deltaproteobacteria bacterium]
MKTDSNFKAQLAKKAALVEAFLASCLNRFDRPAYPDAGFQNASPETPGIPAGLKEAMNYSLLAGGKRIRPVLCISAARLFGLDAAAALPFAAGIECIHSYSLIHDDLPAMDDDDYRRGRLSNHKKFGEAAAILAGDALLTDAFVFMSGVADTGMIAPQNVLKALTSVALAAGSAGMAGGQFLDMQYTAEPDISLEQLAYMQAAKTGAMLAASCHSGALLAGAGEDAASAINAYGRFLGEAFQIVDDILDETGTTEELGKPAGSDAKQGKVTYPSRLGLEKSRDLARAAGTRALAALDKVAASRSFSAEAETELAFLREFVSYLLQRSS